MRSHSKSVVAVGSASFALCLAASAGASSPARKVITINLSRHLRRSESARVVHETCEKDRRSKKARPDLS